jgi:carbon storage regulator
MLVLTRQPDEGCVITFPPSATEQRVRVVVVDVRGDRTRLGFEAEREIAIHRDEVQVLVDGQLEERR